MSIIHSGCMVRRRLRLLRFACHAWVPANNDENKSRVFVTSIIYSRRIPIFTLRDFDARLVWGRAMESQATGG